MYKILTFYAIILREVLLHTIRLVSGHWFTCKILLMKTMIRCLYRRLYLNSTTSVNNKDPTSVVGFNWLYPSALICHVF